MSLAPTGRAGMRLAARYHRLSDACKPAARLRSTRTLNLPHILRMSIFSTGSGNKAVGLPSPSRERERALCEIHRLRLRMTGQSLTPPAQLKQAVQPLIIGWTACFETEY